MSAWLQLSNFLWPWVRPRPFCRPRPALVDLATQTYRVTESTIQRIVTKAEALMRGPRSVPARQLASFKGLVASTWVATGSPTRIRTRAMDTAIGTRPSGSSRAELRRSFAAAVILTTAALDEITWWMANIRRISGQPIQPRPLQGPLDSTIYSDASDTGFGAVVVVEGPPDAQSSLCDRLVAGAPAGTYASAVCMALARSSQGWPICWQGDDT